MKEAFRSQRITPARGERIEQANSILEEYGEQGYRLTLRQLYYQLVARAFIPNNVREYAKLSQTMVLGRMNGLTDWRMIEDRIRTPYLTYAVDSIKEALEETVGYYKRNRQEGQLTHIEIWTEKDAVSNILKRVSEYYHIKLMVNRGYSSCSAMYDASKRMLVSGNPAKILYVGDYDPSGLDMLRDIRERLEEFGVEDFEVIPVALTMEQIKQYNPPPNPAKIKDPRAGWYLAEHGNQSWELDALSPEALEQIVRDAVIEQLDEAAFEEMLEQENVDKERLRKLIEEVEK